MAEQEPPLTLKLPIGPGSRILFSFGLGSELRVTGVRHPASGQGGDAPEVAQFSWGPVTTANQAISYGTVDQYIDLQRAKSAGRPPDVILSKVSQYAQAVRERLQEEKERDSGEGLPGLELALWHLLEIFFVDAPRNEGDLGEDFVLWLAAHHDDLALVVGQPPLGGRLEEVQAEASPAAQPDYWSLLVRLVALGRTREAVSLLDLHDARKLVARGDVAALQQAGIRAQVEVVETLHVLLRRLPRLLPSAGRDASSRAYASRAEFDAARSVWVAQVRELASKQQLLAECATVSRRTAEGVQAVLRVLSGEAAALSAATQDWLELLVADLVHRRPGVAAANQLRALLQQCQADWAAARRRRGGGSSDEGANNGLLVLMGGILQALCQQDMSEVVAVLTSCSLASSWLMAHAMELLSAFPGAMAPGGLLSKPLPVAGCSQVEYFRLAFVQALLPSRGSWQLALPYLAWCPVHGAAVAEKLMDVLPIDSRDVRGVEKAVTACRKLGLGATAAALCRVAGVDALSRGHLGAALQWLGRAGDDRRVAMALQPVMQAVEAALAQHLGSYRAAPLELPGGTELEELLLEWLPGSSSSDAVGQRDDPAVSTSGSGGLVPFLTGVLRLSRAMAALRDAREAPQGAVGDPAAQAALAAGRDALMALVAPRAAPSRLALPLLFYSIPLLESTGAVFSPLDMQQLLAWASESCGSLARAAPGPFGAGFGNGAKRAFGAAELVAAAASLGIPERYAKDVQLALVRGVARAHVAHGDLAR